MARALTGRQDSSDPIGDGTKAGIRVLGRPPPEPRPNTRAGADDPPPALLAETHDAFKYESRPPWTNPDTWRHYCETCNLTLTLADLKTSPITHIVPTAAPSPITGQLQISYIRYPAAEHHSSPLLQGTPDPS
jgi:hypothetical protein